MSPGWAQVAMLQSRHWGVHLKENKTLCFKCFSRCLSHTVSVPLTLWTLLALQSCLGDCALSWSWTFIIATRAGGIIYSSSGCVCCTHYSSLYGREGWREGVDGVWGGLGACSRGTNWVFYCFQHFLLLAGQIKLAVNGIYVKCFAAGLSALPTTTAVTADTDLLPAQYGFTDSWQYMYR